MPLTVADLVATPHLGLQLLAEGDLTRRVRWVHATDQPDPAPYLRGGEVVLTDGLWLGGGTAPTDYVRRLADADVAAIGFGLIEGSPPPPPALIRACQRRRITLFAVPVDVPFLAISELFVDHAVREREEPIRRTLRRSERLLEALAGGADRVLALLGEELGREVRLGPADGAWLRSRVPGAAAELLVARTDRALDVDEQTAIQQALAVLGIEAGHREAVRQTHRRFAAELFELAREAESQAGAIAERLRGLGLDPDGGLVAIVCDRPDPDACLRRFEDALAAAGVRAVATVRGGRLTAVAEWDVETPTDALAAGLADSMGRDAAVGVGSAVAHCALLDVSVGDARRACRLARLRQDAGRSATAALLTSHTGLLAQQDPDVLDHFCRELLDPLLDHDRERGAELVPTLAAFLSSGRRWAATAAALHIHVNTLRHRLARIEALTGRSLDDPGDGVDFHLALRARGLLDATPREPAPDQGG